MSSEKMCSVRADLGSVRYPGVRDGPKVETTSLSAPPPHFIVLSPGPALQPEDCRGADKVENKGHVIGAKCFVLSHVHRFLLSDKNIAF